MTEGVHHPMSKPTTLKVGAHHYEILWDQESWDELVLSDQSEDWDGIVGRSDHLRCRIWIKPGTAHDEEANTLIHEIIHCIWHMGSNLSNLMRDLQHSHEEYLAERQAPWLLGVLRDNPHVVAYLGGYAVAT